jgi:hypothetical protein
MVTPWGKKCSYHRVTLRATADRIAKLEYDDSIGTYVIP